MPLSWTRRSFIALLILLAAATPALAQNVVRVSIGAEAGTLDPQRWQTVNEGEVIRDLFEGLVAARPGGALAPGPPESWSPSPEGTVWPFTLRPDLHWSNGDPLTAEDFVYSLRRQVDPMVAAD